MQDSDVIITLAPNPRQHSAILSSFVATTKGEKAQVWTWQTNETNQWLILAILGLPTWSKEEASITLSHVLCKCETHKFLTEHENKM